jgi:deoxyadenosine/deoxycytidine kinase
MDYKHKPRIISIEGNIGSGKTTLLAKLKNFYKSNPKIVFLREPVNEWAKIVDSDGKTMLEKFYSDQEKYSFAFQMMAYISRLSIIRSAVESNPPGTVFITERCLYTDKHIFAKMLYDQGKIEDVCYQIYLNWFEEFASLYPIESIIWVNAEPEICHQRIHKRARPGEEIIGLDYLIDCNFYHHSYINDVGIKTIGLDGNKDIFENPDIINDWIKKIDLIINCNEEQDQV